MKKMIAGGFILVSGIVLYIGTHIPAALFMIHIERWNMPHSKYKTSLIETGGATANIIGIILSIIGLLMILWECYIKEWFITLKNKIAISSAEFEKEHGMDKLE